jgi:rubrerythrin
MVTTVGLEGGFETLVANLLYLEHDAIAAYEAAIERLQDGRAKQQLESFKDDHLHHVSTLKEIAKEVGIEAPTAGDAKEMLTTGKVKMGSLVGDSAIVKAMRSNEEDTVTAYERASGHREAEPRSKAFFTKALADEKRHREWMANHS